MCPAFWLLEGAPEGSVSVSRIWSAEGNWHSLDVRLGVAQNKASTVACHSSSVTMVPHMDAGEERAWASEKKQADLFNWEVYTHMPRADTSPEKVGRVPRISSHADGKGFPRYEASVKDWRRWLFFPKCPNLNKRSQDRERNRKAWPNQTKINLQKLTLRKRRAMNQLISKRFHTHVYDCIIHNSQGHSPNTHQQMNE